MQLSEDKITRGNAVAVKAAVLAAARSGDAELDLSRIRSVDSTSVSILMSWLRALLAAGRKPKLRFVPEKMVTLMRLYGVKELIAPYFAS